MFITKITIPISDYYGENVFEKQLYFECERRSPTKQCVVDYIKDMIEEEKEFIEESGFQSDMPETLQIVELIPDGEWQQVGYLARTNTFVNHPKFGRQPFSWDVIYIGKSDC